MGLFNWDFPAHRLQNSQLSKTLVPQLWSRDARELSSGLVQEQRRELSLWSLEAQVCWCHFKKRSIQSSLSILIFFFFFCTSKQLVFICVSFSRAMMQSHDNAYPQKPIVQNFSGSHLFPLCTVRCGSTTVC